jgi:predicted alpha/beta hydrolase
MEMEVRNTAKPAHSRGNTILPAAAKVIREPRKVTIACNDGILLAGKLFEPEGAPRVAIVLHGATAVPCRYYEAFAGWLAATRQAAVLIYDYRDYGSSAKAPLRRAKATMAIWGIRDQDAALTFLCAQYPALPIEVIGHSMGGLFLAFHSHASRVRQLTAVASGPAHWTRHPIHFMPAAAAFWFGIGPLLTAALGYMPGRRIGLGSDVPAGVYWQWRRWCITHGFHRADWGKSLPQPRLESVRCLVRAIAISDDAMMPPAVVRDLKPFYPFAQFEHKVIHPADARRRNIGHVSIFTGRCRAVWPELAGGDPQPAAGLELKA